MTTFSRGFFKGGTIAVLFFLFTLVMPLLALAGGWFVGAVIELVTGDFATNTLNHAFDTDRFARGDFQRITAVFAVFASFLAVKGRVKSDE